MLLLSKVFIAILLHGTKFKPQWRSRIKNALTGKAPHCGRDALQKNNPGMPGLFL
jgi:hypothetical protein